MTMLRRLAFLFQFIVVGLAVAFLVLLWKPELFRTGPVVEVREGVQLPAGAAGPYSYADAVSRAAPAVVNINTRKLVTQRPQMPFDDPVLRRFFGDEFFGAPRQQMETSLGSGVIVSPQGYVLTNNHVIDGADEIQVSLRDGRTAVAEVIGTDPEADLAVLRVELTDLPVITLGDSEILREGDVVLAIGNPFGVGQTVTQGIVSAVGRNRLGLTTFEDFIQTDAAINPGNSGGALTDAAGQLIGVNTAIFSRTGGSQGIGFAIPVNLARGIMEEIIELGHVSRGWLGIEIQNITPELAESFGLESNRGVIVAGVLREGPAALAGITPGDIITHVAGKPITSVREALDRIAAAEPDTELEIRGYRTGTPADWQVQVAERPVVSPTP